MSFYVLACMYWYLYVCVYIHLYGHVSACITCNTQVMYTIILGIFSITNIILEVILVHICMYSFILTSISAYVLVYECINKYVVYICLYVLYTYMQSLSGGVFEGQWKQCATPGLALNSPNPPRSDCMGLEVGSTCSCIAWELLFTSQIRKYDQIWCYYSMQQGYRHIHTHT